MVIRRRRADSEEGAIGSEPMAPCIARWQLLPEPNTHQRFTHVEFRWQIAD